MHDIMIDIETLGTGDNALILSIGAVQFDFRTRELGTSFLVNISPESSQRAGFQMDAGTVLWWFGQDDAARRALTLAPTPVSDAFTWLSEYVRTAHQRPRVWANGSNFDLRILRQGYDLLGMQTPWHYRDVRDMRTFMQMMDEIGVKNVPAPTNKLKHDALADAKFQAELMLTYWLTLMRTPMKTRNVKRMET